jgi:hypothetical protein
VLLARDQRTIAHRVRRSERAGRRRWTCGDGGGSLPRVSASRIARLQRGFANVVIVAVLGAYFGHFLARRDDFPFSNFSIFSELRRGKRHVLRSYELVGIDAAGHEVRDLDAPLGRTVFRGWARRAHRNRALRSELARTLFGYNELTLAQRGRRVELAAIELRVTRFVIPNLEARTVERGRSRVMYRYER